MKWPPGPRRNGHIAVGNTRGSRAKADRTQRQREDRRPVGHHPRIERCARPRPPLGTSDARRFPDARPCPPSSIPTGRRSDARPLRRGPRRAIVPTLAEIRAYGEARAAHPRCRVQSRLNVSRGQRLVKAPDHPTPAGDVPDHRWLGATLMAYKPAPGGGHIHVVINAASPTGLIRGSQITRPSVGVWDIRAADMCCDGRSSDQAPVPRLIESKHEEARTRRASRNRPRARPRGDARIRLRIRNHVHPYSG